VSWNGHGPSISDSPGTGETPSTSVPPLAVGGFQAYLHVLGVQIDRFRWETPVAIAEFESRPGAVPRQVLGLIGFFDRFRVTIDDQDERIAIEPRF
jgi:hypothetical protein